MAIKQGFHNNKIQHLPHYIQLNHGPDIIGCHYEDIGRLKILLHLEQA
jgi:hypothetical protein